MENKVINFVCPRRIGKSTFAVKFAINNKKTLILCKTMDECNYLKSISNKIDVSSVKHIPCGRNYKFVILDDVLSFKKETIKKQIIGEVYPLIVALDGYILNIETNKEFDLLLANAGCNP